MLTCVVHGVSRGVYTLHIAMGEWKCDRDVCVCEGPVPQDAAMAHASYSYVRIYFHTRDSWPRASTKCVHVS